MRILKNKITFFVFFLRPVGPGGIIEVPQISRIYTDIFSETYAGWGQEGHADFANDADFFLRTNAVPLVGDRKLRGWLRVLTQQSCDYLSPSGRLYGI